jgi:acyl-CoA thioesterase-1
MKVSGVFLNKKIIERGRAPEAQTAGRWRARIIVLTTLAFTVLGSAVQAQVVALGASNTAGQGVGTSAAFPSVLQRLLRERGISATVINAGVSGDTTEQMLSRLDSAVPVGTKVVIFQAGSNDARSGNAAGSTQATIREITGRLRARGIQIVPAGPGMQAAMPGNLQRDGIHLTARGHEIVAETLLPRVIEALR